MSLYKCQCMCCTKRVQESWRDNKAAATLNQQIAERIENKSPTNHNERDIKAAMEYANKFVAEPRRNLMSWQQEKADDFLAGIAYGRAEERKDGEFDILVQRCLFFKSTSQQLSIELTSLKATLAEVQKGLTEIGGMIVGGSQDGGVLWREMTLSRINEIREATTQKGAQ